MNPRKTSQKKDHTIINIKESPRISGRDIADFFCGEEEAAVLSVGEVGGAV